MSKTKNEALIFLFVGLTAVLIDFIIYTFLLRLDAQVSVSKVSGFLCGTVWAFFANKQWTFEQQGFSWKMPLRFLLVYLINLGVNVGVNRWALFLFPTLISFLFATALSATFNFLGMKFYVFRKV